MASLRLLLHRLGARLFAASPWLVRQWARRRVVVSAGAVPWTPLARPLSTCRVALITTAGVHLDGDPPFDLESGGGDPTFRRIPGDVDRHRLRISHAHYDTRDAERDVNVVFPIERLRELAVEGRIGEVAPTHYGFGWIRAVDRLVRESAPCVARELVQARVDAVVLTPA